MSLKHCSLLFFLFLVLSCQHSPSDKPHLLDQKSLQELRARSVVISEVRDEDLGTHIKFTQTAELPKNLESHKPGEVLSHQWPSAFTKNGKTWRFIEFRDFESYQWQQVYSYKGHSWGILRTLDKSSAEKIFPLIYTPDGGKQWRHMGNIPSPQENAEIEDFLIQKGLQLKVILKAEQSGAQGKETWYYTMSSTNFGKTWIPDTKPALVSQLQALPSTGCSFDIIYDAEEESQKLKKPECQIKEAPAKFRELLSRSLLYAEFIIPAKKTSSPPDALFFIVSREADFKNHFPNMGPPYASFYPSVLARRNGKWSKTEFNEDNYRAWEKIYLDTLRSHIWAFQDYTYAGDASGDIYSISFSPDWGRHWNESTLYATHRDSNFKDFILTPDGKGYALTVDHSQERPLSDTEPETETEITAEEPKKIYKFLLKDDKKSWAKKAELVDTDFSDFPYGIFNCELVLDENLKIRGRYLDKKNNSSYAPCRL